MEELAKTKKIRFGESSEEPEDQVWMKSPKNQPLKCPQTENASGKESKRRNVRTLGLCTVLHAIVLLRMSCVMCKEQIYGMVLILH